MPLNRRAFLSASVATGLILAGCQRRSEVTAPVNGIAAVESSRPHSGRTVTTTLTAGRAKIDLGGTVAETAAYNDVVPGPLIRANVGDELAVTVRNRLSEPTSVHWHGIALRNDMDGAAPATPDIASAQDFTYRFSVPHPGTYWAHPHTGLDLDYGLYLPVIVDDPNDPGAYDSEWIVLLDDWTDGVGSTPQQLYEGLTGHSAPAHDMPGMPSKPDMSSMAGMGGVGISDLLGGDAGDISYPYYLINGRIPAAATTFNAKPGQRIRLRIINAGSDTAFRVALGGHAMTVTHTDGFPVVPTEVDAVLVGMGERYDVVVTAGDGVFPLVAEAEGKNAVARALLITGAGGAPAADLRPIELRGRVGTVGLFTAAPKVVLPAGDPAVTLAVELTGNMMAYDWAINGVPFAKADPMTVSQGQRVRLAFNNKTTMWHPMHLHGHTFEVSGPAGRPGPRKDTLAVLPGQKLDVDFIADNPGDWMLHCHNTYHLVSGMMRSIKYIGA